MNEARGYVSQMRREGLQRRWELHEECSIWQKRNDYFLSSLFDRETKRQAWLKVIVSGTGIVERTLERKKPVERTRHLFLWKGGAMSAVWWYGSDQSARIPLAIFSIEVVAETRSGSHQAKARMRLQEWARLPSYTSLGSQTHPSSNTLYYPWVPADVATATVVNQVRLAPQQPAWLAFLTG